MKAIDKALSKDRYIKCDESKAAKDFEAARRAERIGRYERLVQMRQPLFERRPAKIL